MWRPRLKCLTLFGCLCRLRALAQAGFRSSIPREEAQFQRLVCNSVSFPQCQYNSNPEVTACEENPAYADPLFTFELLLYVTIVVISAKELVKVTCLLRFLCKPIPLHLRHFCGSSPLSVCVALVNRRKFLDELADHEVTAQDAAWAVVWNGAMQDFLTFPLGLYFLLSVGRAGLDSIGVLSEFLGAIGVVLTLSALPRHLRGVITGSDSSHLQHVSLLDAEVTPEHA